MKIGQRIQHMISTISRAFGRMSASIGKTGVRRTSETRGDVEAGRSLSSRGVETGETGKVWDKKHVRITNLRQLMDKELLEGGVESLDLSGLEIRVEDCWTGGEVGKGEHRYASSLIGEFLVANSESLREIKLGDLDANFSYIPDMANLERLEVGDIKNPEGFEQDEGLRLGSMPKLREIKLGNLEKMPTFLGVAPEHFGANSTTNTSKESGQVRLGLGGTVEALRAQRASKLPALKRLEISSIESVGEMHSFKGLRDLVIGGVEEGGGLLIPDMEDLETVECGVLNGGLFFKTIETGKGVSMEVGKEMVGFIGMVGDKKARKLAGKEVAKAMFSVYGESDSVFGVVGSDVPKLERVEIGEMGVTGWLQGPEAMRDAIGTMSEGRVDFYDDLR